MERSEESTLTKQNAAPVESSGKGVRWNEGFAEIHEREMNGGSKGLRHCFRSIIYRTILGCRV